MMAFLVDEEINKLPALSQLFISFFEPSATTEEEHHLVTTAVEETPVGCSISHEENKLGLEAEKTIGRTTCIGDEDISRVLPFISSFELPATVSEDTPVASFLPPENTMVVAEETKTQPIYVQEIVFDTGTAGGSISADAEGREEICVHHEREQRAQPMQVDVNVVSNATPDSFAEFERSYRGRTTDSGYVDISSMTI